MKKFNCVLLVDDDDVSNFISEKVIAKIKLADHTHTSKNGREALSFVSDHCLHIVNDKCPDLILLDIKMPVMDGFQFMEEVQSLKIQEHKNFQVIMLTSSNSPRDIEKALSIGVDGYINKPLSAEKLENVLKDQAY